MKHGILTAAFLMASAGFASADYVIIVANVGATKELKTTNMGMGGMPGMGGGRTTGGPGMPGMPGMPGGGMMPGRPGGQQGGAGMNGARPPGMPGMPGGGGGGLQPPGMGNQGGGSRPGMQMGNRGGGGMPGAPGAPGMPGMPGGSMPGGSMPGGGMMYGNRGGSMPGGGMMYGNRGGMPGGSMGSGMMGMMGMMGLSDDADDIPDYVIAVIEVKPASARTNILTNLLRTGIVSVGLPERLGKSCQLLAAPPFGKIYVILEDKGKPLPAVSVRFDEKFNNAVKEKASSGDFLSVAEWALEHGLVDKLPTVMDKVIEGDKGNTAAVAYLKVKAELDRKAGDDPSAASWREQLLRGYKVTETPHYLIVHNSANDTAVEIKTHGEHLENAFRGFYYWFALKGIALPVPKDRQVVVLTNKADDFDQLRKILTPGPIVVDGFFARRESLTVMHAQRQDDPYKALNTFWENWKGKGYQRYEILHGNKSGLPKTGVPMNVKLAGEAGRPQIAEAQMLALMLKALEQEAELATVSHEASRQLLFASGLMPRNVAVPEWLLFGMGSFFETPLQSPWPTIGAPSPYYLPRWRELKAKEVGKGGLEKTAVATLRKVVGDGYFRTLPANQGKPGDAQHRVYEAALRKARTVSWSLAYFLAQKHLDGLRQYFAELSKMPRDIELDDAVLLGCFARAFGCVDANNKADESKLKTLANEWYGYWQSVHFESENTMKDIRETIAKEVQEAQKNAQNEEQNSNQSGAGMFGGFPPPGMGPGGFPPGGGLNPPGGAPGQGGTRPGTPPQPGGSRPGGPQQGGAGQGGRGQPPAGAPGSPRRQ